ncbi:MAG: peptidoglycan-associated lipoprotein Pal [Methyloprofundus sp.]|nr:peptidoglycan-associated lipoprotein Pal [Methyloprofundus sp.]
MKLKIGIVAFFIATLLSGCSLFDKDSLSEEDNAAQNRLNSLNDRSGVDSNTYNADGLQVTEFGVDKQISEGIDALMQSAEFSDPNSPLSTRTIYFEYDSSQVKNEFVRILEAHANYLMANPNQRITLEGHSDERGTREYNIALGEQRAKSVFKILQLIGVMTSQMDIVSYGEEKPVAPEHTDESFALNRRVEVVYK